MKIHSASDSVALIAVVLHFTRHFLHNLQRCSAEMSRYIIINYYKTDAHLAHDESEFRATEISQSILLIALIKSALLRMPAIVIKMFTTRFSSPSKIQITEQVLITLALVSLNSTAAVRHLFAVTNRYQIKGNRGS